MNPNDYEKNKLRDGFSVDGSGPYSVKIEASDDTVTKAVFTKNSRYKGQLNVKNSQVELRSFTDADTMGAALEKGDIDLMTRSMTPDQINKLDNASGGNVNLNEMPGLEIRYLAFNTNATSVKSAAVRQAMAQVINRGELISKVYGSQAEPLYSLVPATITGHSNAFFNKYGDPSVSRAQGLLTKA